MSYWFLSVICTLFPHSLSIWGNSGETFGIFFTPISTNIQRFPLPLIFQSIVRNLYTHWDCAYICHFPIFSCVELEGNELNIGGIFIHGGLQLFINIYLLLWGNIWYLLFSICAMTETLRGGNSSRKMSWWSSGRMSMILAIIFFFFCC